MKRLQKTSLVITILFIAGFALAQNPPIKLGQVAKNEVAMKEYAPDPDADAVVLCDYGYLTFQFDLNEGEWTNTLKRICRIKIFNDDGYHWATEKISLYDDNKVEQSISQIKGFTYNHENGKLTKTKLGKDDIMKEKISEHYDRVSLTLPNVKEGSIIEFSYTISSNYITILDKWQFQRSIPVIWSEYMVSIPEYLSYMKNSQGFWTFAKYETDSRARSINWTSTTRYSGISGGASDISQHKLDYRDNIFHWVAKDIPGIKDENFVGNYRNYLLSIDFQLAKYRTFDDRQQNILSDWPKIVDKFLKDYENFGPNMRKRNFYKEITEKIMASTADPAERALAVYYYVSQYMKWDGKERIIPAQNIKKSYDDRTGSCADINALLVSMLNAVEVPADPVIISTIDNGLVHPNLPIIDKYNYLIARAIINDRQVLLDATEKNQPFGMLPYRCLNQRGYAISESRSGWVNLEAVIGAEKTVLCLMDLQDDGKMNGTISYKMGGYSGVNLRKTLQRDGEEKYIEKFKSDHADWTIASMDVDAPEKITEPVKEKIEFELDGAAESMGNIIYINPILSGKMDENPLKQEERKLPIEFIIPEKNTFMLTLNIPDGYTVDELPEDINIVTPDRTAVFRYGVQQMGNRLQVLNSWQIKKSFYVPDKFNDLKEFFAIVVAKHNEQIVLKKIVNN